jgi:hypothetical protein
MKKKVNINAIKMGSMISLSVDGKLQKKNCKNADEANTLFKAILKAKENPTDENIKGFLSLMSDKVRIAMLAGLENDPLTGEVFLSGFNTPIPQALVDVIEDYAKNKYPIDAIINFWKLLMINPDKRIREKLFDFIKIHDFALTDNGYMVVYKAVDYKDQNKKGTEKTFEEYISNQVLHVKKDWKCNPRKYDVYKSLANGEYGISKVGTVEKWDEKARNIEVLGNLDDLFKAIFESPVDELLTAPVYTDLYSHSTTIILGQPEKTERGNCDGDPDKDCSIGRHCGSTSYVNNYGNGADAILVCYVNPMNVISVPKSECSKMRVCEYYPFAVATYENGKIDVIQQKYFEDDYISYEEEELEEMIAKVQAEELPLANAKNAESESRSMSELLKIISTRLIDIE